MCHPKRLLLEDPPIMISDPNTVLTSKETKLNKLNHEIEYKCFIVVCDSLGASRTRFSNAVKK